ncbi:M-phase inducer phosphatase-like isoform X2 [Prorops nasuta]
MSQIYKKIELSKIQEEISPKKNEDSISEMISPVSSIIRQLSKSTLATGETPTRNQDRLNPRTGGVYNRCHSDPTNNTRLFKSTFKIKGTPEGLVKSKTRARRLLGMASRRLSSSESVCASPQPAANKQHNGAAICSSLTFTPPKVAGIKRVRIPLEDCDPNSQDSGYGASYPEEKSRNGFQFAEPCGVAPRRLSVESRSPIQSPIRSSPLRQRAAAARHSFFRSLSSGYESMDDGFNELIDMDTFEESTRLPNGISNLLSGEIVSSDIDKMMMECDVTTTPERTKQPSGSRKTSFLRRSLSLQNSRQVQDSNSSTTPPLSKVRSCLFRSPNSTSSTAKLCFDENPRERLFSSADSPPPPKSFKRPEPPTEESPKLAKRCKKSTSFQAISEITSHIPKKKACLLQRSFSETEAHAHIKSAIHRSTTDSDLTGDFSKPCALPLASGDHEDLKSISAETLASLIHGEFHDRVHSFKIVDCRYPYEFEGGHINGAINLYSKDLIEQILLDPLDNTPEIEPDSYKRSILVFHCEFSWERGPNLSRFLRNLDRQRNKEHYPALHYPEMYLLHGGYEQFYREYMNLCTPKGYRPMRDPNHEADLKQFRSKSKSWQGDKVRTNILPCRTNLKRLGF